MTDKLYTVPEAAEIIGIKANSLSKRIRAGLVPYADRTSTKYLLSADAVEAERKRVAGVAAGTLPRQNPHKPKTAKVAPSSTLVEEFWGGNWATIDPAKRRQRPPVYGSMAEAIAAARQGQVTAVVLDTTGNKVGEKAWRR